MDGNKFSGSLSLSHLLTIRSWYREVNSSLGIFLISVQHFAWCLLWRSSPENLRRHECRIVLTTSSIPGNSMRLHRIFRARKPTNTCPPILHLELLPFLRFLEIIKNIQFFFFQKKGKELIRANYNFNFSGENRQQLTCPQSKKI